MAAEGRLTEMVRVALKGVSDVQEKRMFGGFAFMVAGKMCVTSRDSRIMCRVDPAEIGRLTKMKGCRQATMKSGRVFTGYIHVNGDVLKTQKEVNYWVGVALSFNRTLKDKRD